VVIRQVRSHWDNQPSAKKASFQQDFTDFIGSYKTDLRKKQHLTGSIGNLMQNRVFRYENAWETL
jgi:hypothetical protein